MRALLEGQVAVVPWASRGLGRGIALALGEAGATVYISGRKLDAGGSGRGTDRHLPEGVQVPERAHPFWQLGALGKGVDVADEEVEPALFGVDACE
jgi:NAD(P)-dependent dehydrogenase (short-subunit alcohol dehydrogenase family)